MVFYTVAAAIDIPTNSAQVFAFLHTLDNTCYLLFFLRTARECLFKSVHKMF